MGDEEGGVIDGSVLGSASSRSGSFFSSSGCDHPSSEGFESVHPGAKKAVSSASVLFSGGWAGLEIFQVTVVADC